MQYPFRCSPRRDIISQANNEQISAQVPLDGIEISATYRGSVPSRTDVARPVGLEAIAMSHMRKFLGRIENPLRQATGDTAHADLPKDIRLLLRTLERIERRLNSTHTALLHRTLRDALATKK